MGEKEEGEGTITDIVHEHNYPVLCKQQRQTAKKESANAAWLDIAVGRHRGRGRNKKEHNGVVFL